MAKATLATEMLEQPSALDHKPQSIGPFLTISRQYGCHGFSLGLLLWDLLNEHSTRRQTWQIYHKDILSRLATETNMAEELLEQELYAPNSLISEFFKFFSREHIPSGFEIRHRIITIIRGLAIQGNAIIMGQGGALATHDLPNGLSIRLEAPEEWRVKQVAFREGLSMDDARLKVRKSEEERIFLRGLYESKIGHHPLFNIVYDCSAFTLTQIAQNVLQMMKMKNML